MTPKIGIALFTAGSLLALDAGTAGAQTDVRNTSVFQIADGENCGLTNRDENGREYKGDNYQACAEHATLVQLEDPRDIVMFRLASKDELNGEPVYDRAQLACSSITLTPEGPQLNVDKYVTDNDGHEYRNAHASHAVPIDEGKAVAVFYNYRPDDDTQRYVQVFDKNCNSLSEQTLVMAYENDDMCATLENYSHLVTQDAGGETKVVAGCGGNGNGKDDGWVYETRFERQPDGTYQAARTWRVDDAVAEEERERHTLIHVAAEEMVAACTSDGDSQPSDNGVSCIGIDIRENIEGADPDDDDNRRLWKEYVAKRDGRIYQTQIKLAPSLGNPDEATATWTTIERRRRRGKGAASLNMVRLKFSRQGMDIMTLPVGGTEACPGCDATHRAMVSTPWGVDGQEKEAIVLVSSSVNGSPNATANAQILTWNGQENKFYRERQLGLNSAIDNAWISNIYGNNPNTQGRNHIQSRVFENPYYGDPQGFRPEVKTFVATAATPRLMREGTNIAQDKLAFQLLLTPAVVAPEAEPEAPEEEPLDPADPEDGDSGTTEPDPGTDTDTDTGTGSNTGGSSVNGVGCSASPAQGLGGLAFIGLAFLVAFGIRRRRC